MSRSVSSAFLQAALAQETGEVYVVLVEIDHADLVTPIRAARSNANVLHNGNTYHGMWFETDLPDDLEEQLPEITLVIQNVDRAVVEAVRTVSSAPTVTVKVVLASDPDTVEAGPWVMTLRQAAYNALTVSGSVLGPDILTEPYPGDAMTPANFPGLF